MAKSKKAKHQTLRFARNKKAIHDYFFMEGEFEAVMSYGCGSQKASRRKKVQLYDSYVIIKTTAKAYH